jgi:hypothetical protein
LDYSNAETGSSNPSGVTVVYPGFSFESSVKQQILRLWVRTRTYLSKDLQNIHYSSEGQGPKRDIVPRRKIRVRWSRQTRNEIRRKKGSSSYRWSYTSVCHTGTSYQHMPAKIFRKDAVNLKSQREPINDGRPVNITTTMAELSVPSLD